MLVLSDAAQVLRLEEDAANTARVLDEQQKKAASLAHELEEQKKESANRDHYDKTLSDRLSIVAEGLAGNLY